MIEFKLAEIMGKHRVKMKDVSDQTGIRANTISAYWYGTVKRMEVEHIDLLCDYFNCQPGDLITHIKEGEGH